MVDEKDDYSRQMFLKLYGFDLFADHDVFDFIVDSSELIPVPTWHAAQIGVAILDPVLRHLSKWALAARDPQRDAEPDRGAFWRAAASLPAGALRKVPSALAQPRPIA